MKRIFLLAIICGFVYKAQAQSQVTFFLGSDPDDWQLFMSKKMLDDLDNGNSKVVFICVTAGDEGFGNTIFNGSSIAYYLAKERGAVYSGKFASDITNPISFPTISYDLPAAQTVTVNSKSVTKYVYGNANGVGNVVSYFLRLADGGPAGAGYAGTGNKSLQKLKLGQIANMTSLDGVTTYTWGELLLAIKGIIYAEKGVDQQIYLNTPSLSAVNNPGDNSDHYYASTAAQEILMPLTWVGINEFVMDYSSSLGVGANLNSSDYEDASAVFNVYNWSLVKDKYPSKLNATTRGWLPKESFSVTRVPTGNGALPVVLVNFSGTLKGNNVLLDWSTSAEYSSKEFQLERSNDGITYRKLATVAAAGFSTTAKKYTYLDVEATEVNYYRLKMVDIDGSNKQSDVVIVKNSALLQSAAVVNNPFSNHIDVRFARLPKGGVTLRLIDLSGKLIAVKQNYQPSLSSIIRFDIDRPLSRGIYILQVENDGKQYSIKVLKD